ncbi:ribonuclease PH [Mucisphaera calidilacus]|uniref:Ribonuclease PH n=1 Tax=Mucisphaera calidilacus TaxID=2527982 RepID=A0A518BWB0_9BACT|nr:ribonuclease PH [Mucisphaera calidilacus]QDU71265.1 Ribonuclease PH [Mucisphaera calidilacus]
MPRRTNQLRDVTIESFPTAAAGSVLITAGQTRVLCTASIASQTPRWIPTDDDGNPEHGWVTAEYAMLPGSTPDRKRRGNDGRSTEIQRLIGRSLRAGVDLKRMPGLAVTCDCDVLSADGGTRTAAITGSWVALVHALRTARTDGLIKANPVIGPVAAVSVGIIDGTPHLDLDYPLDSRADVDLNVVMNHKEEYIEVQGTAEGTPFDRKRLDQLLELAGKGIRSLIKTQRATLKKLKQSKA